MSKFFIINPDKEALPKEAIQRIEKQEIEGLATAWQSREERAKQEMEDDTCKLKYMEGRVIIKVNLESKNTTTFADGTTIRLERDFNNFNRRETQPVNAVVISAEYVPRNSEILIWHNALHDTNKLFSYKSTSPDVQYYSIPETDCFAWRDENGELQPMKNFAFAYRIFKPYSGLIAGIMPSQIKDVLYLTTGEFAGQVAMTVKAADYELIYQGQNGKEEHLIRCRHFENEDNDKEEIICINHELTEQVNRNELHIGLSITDCKPLSEYPKHSLPCNSLKKKPDQQLQSVNVAET